MILGFSAKFQDGTPTNFRDKILKGIKQTTIREDKNDRYKVGTKLHLAEGVRTKNYNCFAEGLIDSLVLIIIKPQEKEIYVMGITSEGVEACSIKSHSEGMEKVIKLEGFDSEEQFWKWFNKPLAGKMIHWKLK